MDLLENQRKAIETTINDLFYELKVRLLGRFFTGPKIYFEVLNSVNPLDTLEGVYNYTYAMLYGPGAKPSKKRAKKLAQITGNYIEAERLKTINKIMVGIDEADTVEEVQDAISTQMDKTTSYINKLVATEVRNTQANAEREGIEKIGASIGVDDPVVCKLGVVDPKLCDNCKKLWHSDDNIKVPKVYKLSQLKDGYNSDHKNPKPTTLATHPHCRHVLTMVPPNFGFTDDGVITFKGFGYDIYEDQRGR